MYFPRELASQIHCYMTGLGPNPEDVEAAPHPSPAKRIYPVTYSNE